MTEHKSQRLSMVEAAWAEYDGLGRLSVVKRSVCFESPDGYRIEWPYRTRKEAKSQVRLSRAVLSNPETRPRSF